MPKPRFARSQDPAEPLNLSADLAEWAACESIPYPAAFAAAEPALDKARLSDPAILIFPRPQPRSQRKMLAPLRSVRRLQSH